MAYLCFYSGTGNGEWGGGGWSKEVGGGGVSRLQDHSWSVCVAVKVQVAATKEGRVRENRGERGTERGNLQMWLYLQISCQKSHLERIGQIPAQWEQRCTFNRKEQDDVLTRLVSSEIKSHKVIVTYLHLCLVKLEKRCVTEFSDLCVKVTLTHSFICNNTKQHCPALFILFIEKWSKRVKPVSVSVCLIQHYRWDPG